MCVAVSREHLEYPVFELQYRDVECAAAKIIDSDDGLVFFVDAVRKRSRGGFIHDPQYFKPRQMARVFCSLPLSVVEVSRNGYDSLRNFFAEELRGAPFEITKYECGNLRRGEDAVAHLAPNHLLAT